MSQEPATPPPPAPPPPAPPPASPPPASQFGLGAMLGCFVAVAMSLAYLRTYNSVEVFQNAAIVVTLATLWGAIVGRFTARMKSATFWAVMISTAGYISVVGEVNSGAGFHFAWAAVGASAGGIAGAVRSSMLRRIVASCVGGTAPMIVYALFAFQRIDLLFDVVAAAIVGALIGVLVEIIMWLERQSQVPRYVTASWLLCAVIIGNLMVPLVRG